MAQPTPNPESFNEYALVESSFASTTHGVLYKEVRRIQKLASAILLVTQHLKDSDLIKRHLRNHVLELLDIGHVAYDYELKEVTLRIGYMLSHIDALMSFIEVARTTAMISDANAVLLARELASLHMHLSGVGESVSESIKSHAQRIPDQDVRVADILAQQTQIPNTQSQNTKNKNQHNQNDTVINSKNQIPNSKTNSNLKDTTTNYPLQPTTSPQNIKDTSTNYSLQPTSSSPQNPQDKVFRKGQIISIIKDIGEVTIKDIASRILRCSEKTLQRDLQDLLNDKIIVKTGDRRWSKYKMAS